MSRRGRDGSQRTPSVKPRRYIPPPAAQPRAQLPPPPPPRKERRANHALPCRHGRLHTAAAELPLFFLRPRLPVLVREGVLLRGLRSSPSPQENAPPRRRRQGFPASASLLRHPKLRLGRRHRLFPVRALQHQLPAGGPRRR